MSSLPSGTVAFLMTDIEGSTRLVTIFGDAFPQMLDAHFSLLDGAVTAHGGTVVSSEGDALFAVFPAARQAIAAAIDGQRALAAHAWATDAGPRVRMGIHAGEAVFGGRDYTGLDVHRTARIAGAAWGGEILISEATRALTSDALPDGATLRDLGMHGLRDVPGTERLYQVLAPELPTEFPPPRTSTVAPRTNLPVSLTRFVGRRRELAELGAMLERERLVTLTGPGGTGKTRLATETARRLLGTYPDGVWFIALDTVRDPRLVLPTIARTLGVPERPGWTVADALAEHLAGKRALLVLDNLEQVVEAAQDIEQLLGSTEDLTVLGSSREPLGIGGERVYPVSTLDLPGEPGRPSAADLAASESVELFVDRARAARPSFELTDENAPAVAAICRRLDGLPLALELAAARSNLLAPAQILARLERRLALVASARRDLPDRQRTLRGAIDWSHDLLHEPERVVFRRFSVFAGGADLEAALAIVDPDDSIGGDPLDVLGSLVDRSLVRSTLDAGEARFEMLETIREYASERLAESREEEAIRARHARYFAELAEPHRDVATDPRQREILDRFDQEIANLRAAMAWSLDRSDATDAVMILASLHDFWHMRGHLVEARAALDRALAATENQGPTAKRATTLQVAAELAGWHGDYPSARALAERAGEMARAAGDLDLEMRAKSGLGWASISSAPEAAIKAFEETIVLARELGQRQSLGTLLGGLSLALIRIGDLDGAERASREGADASRRSGDLYNVAFAHASLAAIGFARRDLDAALSEGRAVIHGAHEAGGSLGVAIGLDVVALVALERGDAVEAARYGAAAAQLRELLGGGPTLEIVGLEPPLARAQAILKPAEFDRAVTDGRAMPLDDVIAEALGERESN